MLLAICIFGQQEVSNKLKKAIMANNKLKAFVRYDGSGKIVPGSLILQNNTPKVGNWQQIDANECCNPIIGEYLLQEDDSPLLQEDGERIIL